MKLYKIVCITILVFLSLGILINWLLYQYLYLPYFSQSYSPTSSKINSNKNSPTTFFNNNSEEQHNSEQSSGDKLPLIKIKPSNTSTQTIASISSSTPTYIKTFLYIPTDTITSIPKSTYTIKPTLTQKPTITPKPSPTGLITPSITPLPFKGSLLISEVMVNPTGLQPQNEWIEINNPNDYPVDLTNFKIGDEETPHQSEGMYLFPEGTVLYPNQLYIIAYQAIAFESMYGFSPNAEFEYSRPYISQMIPFIPWSKGTINLHNSEDEVILIDGANQILDVISWGKSPHSPNLSSLSIKQSESFERFPTFHNSHSIGDWRVQQNPNPAGTALYPTTTPTIPTLTPTSTFTLTYTPTPPADFTPVANLPILITEIYFPKAEENVFNTWFKVCNPHETLYASIAHKKIGDILNLYDAEGLYEFPLQSEIGPNQCILIAYQAAKFESLYRQKPDYELQDTDNDVTNLNRDDEHIGSNFWLNPANDELVLLDEGFFPIDGIGWGSSLYEPKITFAIIPGCSLKRESTDQSEWYIQCHPIPNPLFH